LKWHPFLLSLTIGPSYDFLMGPLFIILSFFAVLIQLPSSKSHIMLDFFRFILHVSAAKFGNTDFHHYFVASLLFTKMDEIPNRMEEMSQTSLFCGDILKEEYLNLISEPVPNDSLRAIFHDFLFGSHTKFVVGHTLSMMRDVMVYGNSLLFKAMEKSLHAIIDEIPCSPQLAYASSEIKCFASAIQFDVLVCRQDLVDIETISRYCL
jgi:hypothetical protein